MFVIKDRRKVVEVLYDKEVGTQSLKLGRREAEFSGTTKLLCEPTHGPQLSDTKYLSLYGNKLTSLTQVSTLAKYATSLEAVNLGHNLLQQLPASFGGLTSLRHLWIDDNLLTEFPSSLLYLRSLEVLRLSGNKIASIPSGIGKLTGLQELAIDSNALTSVPDDICKLTSLHTLIMRGNQITALPDHFGAFVALKSLIISSNRLKALPASIGNCSALATMLANGNQLKTLPPTLGHCKQLKKLNIANNRVVYLPTALVACWSGSLPQDVVVSAANLEQTFQAASPSVRMGSRSTAGPVSPIACSQASTAALLATQQQPSSPLAGGGASSTGGTVESKERDGDDDIIMVDGNGSPAVMMASPGKTGRGLGDLQQQQQEQTFIELYYPHLLETPETRSDTIEIILDANPLVKQLEELRALEGSVAVAALSDTQYVSPLVHSIKKKSKH